MTCLTNRTDSKSNGRRILHTQTPPHPYHYPYRARRDRNGTILTLEPSQENRGYDGRDIPRNFRGYGFSRLQRRNTVEEKNN